MTHPLRHPLILGEIERAVSHAIGDHWTCVAFRELDDRASHPCGVLHGGALSVFAKFSDAGDAATQFACEVHALNFIRNESTVAVSTPVGDGFVTTEIGSALILQALDEKPAAARTNDDWAGIGRALAALHRSKSTTFGRDRGGFFGPLPQDNSAVAANTWAEFYAERRLAPLLRSAHDSGHLPNAVAAKVDRLARRISAVAGPEPDPALLHGDAQANNFLLTRGGAVIIDAAPYFGHPEVDLALVDYFEPVPDAVFDGYREQSSIDPDFSQRRELWRIFAYLAVITVDGANPFGNEFVGRLDAAVDAYL